MHRNVEFAVAVLVQCNLMYVTALCDVRAFYDCIFLHCIQYSHQERSGLTPTVIGTSELPRIT